MKQPGVEFIRLKLTIGTTTAGCLGGFQGVSMGVVSRVLPGSNLHHPDGRTTGAKFLSD